MGSLHIPSRWRRYAPEMPANPLAKTHFPVWRSLSHESLWNVVFFLGLVGLLFTFNVPRLELDVTAPFSGATQLFYRHKAGVYSENWSSTSRLSPGRQVITFRLPWYFTNPVRWDPPNSPGHYILSDAKVTIAGLRVGSICSTCYSAMRHIAEIRLGPIIEISTVADAFDPQVGLVVPYKRVMVSRLLISALEAVILVLGGAVASRLGRRWVEKLAEAIEGSESLLMGYAREFGVLMLIGGIGTVYRLAAFSLNIDDELAAFRGDRECSVWIADGRWAAYLLERFLFPQPVVPFLMDFLFLGSVAMSYMLLLRIHGEKQGLNRWFLFPIYVLFPTWAFILEFHSNAPGLALGLLSTMCSAYLAVRGPWTRVFAASGLLALAIGSYQAFVTLFVAVSLGGLLARRIAARDEQGAEVAAAGDVVRGGATLLGGLLIYGAIDRLAKSLIRTNYTYIANFWALGTVLTDPLGVAIRTLGVAASFYSGAADKYGIGLIGIPIAVVLAGLSLALPVREKNGQWKHVCLDLFVFGGVLCSPFLLHLVTNANVPTRAVVGLAYVLWVCGSILVRSKSAAVKLAGFGAVLLLEIGSVVANSTYSALNFLVENHDRMLAADLYRRMGETDPGFNPEGAALIDIYGSKKVNLPYRIPNGGTMGASFFEWEGGNAYRVAEFMRLLGYQNIQVADERTRREMTPYFADMPIWPAKGSVRKVGNVFLIKLGNTPDPARAGR